MAVISIDVGNVMAFSGNVLGWINGPPNLAGLGDIFSPQPVFLGYVEIGQSGQLAFNLADSTTSPSFPGGPELDASFETSGTVTFESSDSQTLGPLGIDDSTEPYRWTPAPSQPVVDFYNHLLGLTDRSLTVTFNDNSAIDHEVDGGNLEWGSNFQRRLLPTRQPQPLRFRPALLSPPWW